jgi:hypothetical protein
MNEDQRAILEQWARDYPTAQEGSPSTIDLAAGQIRARRDAAVEADLWAQVDALGDALAVELAAPAEQLLIPEQVATLNNVAVDAHVEAVTAAVNGDESALESALAQHAATLRSLADSAPSAGPTPDQYRWAPAPSTPTHPLIANQPLPSTDARQSRGVAGTFPLIGGGPLRPGPD